MSQPLMIRFGTDTEGAKRGSTDLAATIAGNMAKISTSMLAAGRNVDQGLLATVARTTASVGAMQLALAGGAIASFAIITAAVDQANAQLDRYIELGEKAGKVGVNVEFFQKFVASGGEAKDSVEALEKALTYAGKQAREEFEKISATRKVLGELLDSGATGNFQSKGLRQFDQAGDNEGRIRATLVAMRELQDLGVKLADIKLGEAMFGPEFGERLRQGKVDLAAMIDSLDQARGKDIITREQVQQAEDLRARIEDAKTAISDAIGVSFSLAGAGNAVLVVWANILETVVKAVRAMSSWSAPNAQTLGLLQQQQTDRTNRSNARDAAREMALGNASGRAAIEAENATRARARTSGFLQSERDFRATPEGDPRISTQPIPPRPPTNLPAIREGFNKKAAGGGGGSDTESLDQIERFISQLERARDVAKAELDNIGKSNVEREKAVELAKAAAAARAAGRDLTDEETAKILRLAEAQQTLKDRIMDVRQAQAAAAEATRYFGSLATDALGSIIFDGAKASDVLRNLATQLAKAALQAALTGQGPLASLFGVAPAASAGSNAVGGLFGLFPSLFRAGGGDVSAGRAYTVGELGREMFIPDRDGRIVPMGRAGGGGAAGGAITLSPTYRIDARGSQMSEGQFRAILAQNNAQLRSEVPSLVVDAQRRAGA